MNVTLHPEPMDQTQSEVDIAVVSLTVMQIHVTTCLIFKCCYQKAVSKSRSGDHVAAVDLFTSAISCDPNNILYYVGRSEAFLKCECFRRALEDATKAVRYDDVK
jgi:hypothetical protein